MTRPLPFALFLSLLLPAVAMAEDAWTTRAADALRWPDAEQVSLKLDEGTRVTVVYRADGMVRVRSGDSFGWVPADALTATNPGPAAPATDAWEIPDIPTLELPAMGKGPKIAPKLDAAPAAPAVTPTE